MSWKWNGWKWVIAAAFALFVLLGLYLSFANAQVCGYNNPQCLAITPANGDNSNRIATTAFVASNAGTPTLPTNDIFVGNGSNVATAVPLSGDCTIVASGAITCLKTGGTAFGPLATLPSPLATANGGTGATTATANSYFGNTSNSSGAPAFQAWSNCNGGNSALQYLNGTGSQCNTSVASLSVVDQLLTGGNNVTSASDTTGNITIDCGKSPLQFQTNGAAFTLTAPTHDGSCMLLSTNNASAGTITFSGFTVGANTGDALDTTNGHIFTISIWRINGTAAYSVFAHQ